MNRYHHRILLAVVVVIVAAIPAPAASAAITPTLALTQTASQAGSSSNVTLDLKFAPTGTDSPRDLTVALPPGLLANASLNDGSCLRSTAAVAACQIGSGTVTATPILLGLPIGVPLPIPIKFYLVAPPAPADLAGVLTVANLAGITSQLGSPAEVTVRPAGDPASVGLTERFSNLPNTFVLPNTTVAAPISVTELKSTFTALRLPATCPSPAAEVTVTADSYADATGRTTTAPLKVSACSSLPFAPKFGVTATRDSGDSGVEVITDITQKANEAPSRTVGLTLPPSVLAPNAAAVIGNGLLCSDPTLATCKSIGTATSISPLYPKPLTGIDYLTGSLASPAITIRFPAPFALTLNGAVTLATGTTRFSNLPDIPLTDLKVTLSGGPAAAFAATCNPPNGTATSVLTTQNGDFSVTDEAPFTVAHCTAPGSGSGSNGSGSGSGGSTHNGGSKAGRPRLTAGVITGLGHGRPSLRFTAIAGRNAPRLITLTVALPHGLGVVRHHRKIAGVALRGASLAGVSLSHGRLIVRFRRATGRVTVTLRHPGLRESAGLWRRARRHRVHRLTLGVQVRDAARHVSRLSLAITRIRL